MRRTLYSTVPRSIVQICVAALLVFLLLNFAPGDAAFGLAGENATAEQVAEVRERLGLDRNVLLQYVDWLGSAVHGDLGSSLASGEPVTEMLGRGIPRTASLVGLTLLVAIVLGFGFGILASLKPHGPLDRGVVVVSSLGASIPGFVVALVLVSALAVGRSWLPAVGYTDFAESPMEWLRHLVLPALSLALLPAAEIARQLRGALVDELATQHLLAAQGKGLRRRQLIFKHALRNAVIPVTAVLGVRVSNLVAGTVVIETIFTINGLGSTVVQATLARDVPVVLGVTVVTTIAVLATGALIDLLQPILNPRLRTL